MLLGDLLSAYFVLGILDWASVNFCKGQIANILGFVGQQVSVGTTHSVLEVQKAAINNM